MSYMPVITSHHNVLKEKDIHQRQTRIYLTIDNQNTWNADGNTDIAQASQSKVVHTTPAANPFQLKLSWQKATTTGIMINPKIPNADVTNQKKDYSHLPFTNICQTTHLRLIFVPLIPSTDAKVRERSCY